MAISYISRAYEFSASHRLYLPDLSDEENFAIYGICSNKHGHGHNYRLEITLKGPLDERTGMVLHLSKLDEVVQKKVLPKLDHRHLNIEVEEFQKLVPTAEVVATVIWQWLVPDFKEYLYEIKVYETPAIYGLYRGE